MDRTDTSFNKLVDNYLIKQKSKHWLDNHDPFEDNDIKLCEYCGCATSTLVTISEKWANIIVDRRVCNVCLDTE